MSDSFTIKLGHLAIIFVAFFLFGFITWVAIFPENQTVRENAYADGAKCAIKFLHNKRIEMDFNNGGIVVGKGLFFINEDCRKLMEEDIKYGGLLI